MSVARAPQLTPIVPRLQRATLRVHWSDRVAHALLILAGLALVVFLLAPLAMILAKSVQDRAGDSEIRVGRIDLLLRDFEPAGARHTLRVSFAAASPEHAPQVAAYKTQL